MFLYDETLIYNRKVLRGTINGEIPQNNVLFFL